MTLQIVIDTNVFIAALRSNRGASFKLLTLIGRNELFEINISVPLIFEYEDAAVRHSADIDLSIDDVNDIIDYICAAAHRRHIHFLWRPWLRDPKDDMVLELAVEAQCEYIISFNKRDFLGIEQFGIRVLTPREFLKKIKAI